MIMETTVVTLLDVPKVREELAEFGIHCVLLRNVLTLWELGAQDPEPIITVARRNKQVTAIICQQGDTTDEGPSWYQMLTPNSKPNLDLKQMLQKFVDWKKIQLCFANVPFLMKETLYAVAAENNVHLLSVESSTEDHPALYTPSPKLPSSQHKELPKGFTFIECIDLKWARLINDTWDHGDENSIHMVENLLKNRLPVGVLHTATGNLVAWFSLMIHGQQGLLQVIPEHRQKGIAKAVVLEMRKKLAKLDMEPVVIILNSNETSRRLFEGCGYQEAHHVFWTFRK